MITDINRKKTNSELDRTRLKPYWSKYFEFEIDIDLYNLAKNELISVINATKKKDRPYIDSQIVISNILTDFGQKHIFHRKFRENHPNSDSGQVLGMQLYHLILKDNNIWVFAETKHQGHKFSHATYFI